MTTSRATGYLRPILYDGLHLVARTQSIDVAPFELFGLAATPGISRRALQPPGTRLTSICPPVGAVRAAAAEQPHFHQRIHIVLRRRLPPPVTSTGKLFNQSTCCSTSSTDILSPSVNAYVVSHHAHQGGNPQPTARRISFKHKSSSPSIESKIRARSAQHPILPSYNSDVANSAGRGVACSTNMS